MIAFVFCNQTSLNKTIQNTNKYLNVYLLLSCSLFMFFSFFFSIFIWDFLYEISFSYFSSISAINYVCSLNTDIISQYLIEMVAPVSIFMLTIVLCAIYYTIQFSCVELTKFLIYTACVFFSGIFFLIAENVYGIFIAYESLLIPTCLLLYNYSKTTERSREAVNFMIL